MERLATASSKDGGMVSSTSSKKNLGVVTLLVTAEREQVYFFGQEGSFFAHASPLFLSGNFCNFFIFVFNLI